MGSRSDDDYWNDKYDDVPAGYDWVCPVDDQPNVDYDDECSRCGRSRWDDDEES